MGYTLQILGRNCNGSVCGVDRRGTSFARERFPTVTLHAQCRRCGGYRLVNKIGEIYESLHGKRVFHQIHDYM